MPSVQTFLLALRGHTNLEQEFDPTTEAVKRCLDVQAVVHPYNHVVNSLIVGKVRN
jgi:nicotianamine synthase